MQKCPFDAIMIINLPKNLERETTHRYGPNSFKLHRQAIHLTCSEQWLKAEHRQALRPGALSPLSKVANA